MKYKIGDVERILGISAETLRFFEKKGLVIPHKNESNNYRNYDTLDLKKLVAYKLYRSMDFSMGESAEILNSQSHTETFELICTQIDLIQQRVKYQQSLLARMGEIKHSFERVEIMGDNFFCIEDSPEVLFYCNQVNDVFKTEEEQSKLSHQWLNQLPFIHMALFIPREEIPLGKRVNWGYAVNTKYQDIVAQLESPLTKRVPSQKSVYTILKCSGNESVNSQSLQKALSYLVDNNLILNGDVIGWIINEERDCSRVIRYFEVWLPVAEER